MSQKKTVIVWFRRDLRLSDNPAFWQATQLSQAILPLYIHAPEEEKTWRPGAASLSWLHHSLSALKKELEEKGLRLIFRKGPSLKTLQNIVEESGASALYWNRCYEPALIQRDQLIQSHFKNKTLDVKSFKTKLLFEPWEIQNKQGKPFQVFTPFWNHCLGKIHEIEKVLPVPKEIIACSKKMESLDLNELKLLPSHPWDKNFYKILTPTGTSFCKDQNFTPGEKGAQLQLQRFLKNISPYKQQRDFPASTGTSKLSPHLHFGEISPKQILFALFKNEGKALPQKINTQNESSAESFLRELGWREFAHHLLYHFPDTPEKPLRKEFEKFPWQTNQKFMKAWQQGLTGYPIVDAGMRELWKTGWMHNRVRMIVASFLVKDLLLSWQEGARWFWDTLLDADLANNTLGWQWSAGCGADAAPYFRIFNPVLQGEKFDPEGKYIRKWIPELEKVPNEFIHQPWKSKIKTNYPSPLVDHNIARQQALSALAKIKK